MNAKQKGSPQRRSQDSMLDDIFLQPWFVNKKCAAAIRRLLPETSRHKMRFYFEDWGCLICRTKVRGYGSNGMCHVCTTRIQKRLFMSLKRRHEAQAIPVPPQELRIELKRVSSARSLLRDLPQSGDVTSARRLSARQLKWRHLSH